MFSCFFLILIFSILGISTTSLVILWVVFFSLTVFFLFCASYSFESQINIFLIQEITSFGFLFCLLTSSSSGFLLFIFFLNIGLVPLHFWVFSVFHLIFWNEMVVFLSFLNLLPLWFLLQIPGEKASFFFFLFSFLSCLFLFESNEIKSLLIFSSSIHFFWLLLLSSSGEINSLFYFIFYCFFLFYFLFFLGNSSEKTSTLFFVLIIGVPPFLFFTVNWITIFFFLQNTFLFSGLLLQLVVLSFFSYFQNIFRLLETNLSVNNILFSSPCFFIFFLPFTVFFFNFSLFLNRWSSNSNNTLFLVVYKHVFFPNSRNEEYFLFSLSFSF